jgi:hypothetical protein
MQVVLVHIGNSLPLYLLNCIQQLRHFVSAPIHVLLERQHMDKFNTMIMNLPDIYCIGLEDIPKTSIHYEFMNGSSLSQGFWRSASERFFYLYEYCLLKNLTNVVHIENDNLIYYDFTKFLDIALDSSFMTNANLHRTLKNFRKSNTLSRKFASFYVPLLLQWAKSTLLTTDDGEEQLDDLICRGQLNGLRRIQGIELVFLCFLDKVFSVSLHDDVSDDEFKRVDNLKKFFVSSS